MSEGRKDDAGKLRWQLLRKGCVHALEAVIRVLQYGANKYGDDNWKSVEKAEVRYRDALDRHLASLDKGIIYDEDTGEHQLAHVATNALFLLELHEAKKAGSVPAPRPKEPWRKHTPGERPVETVGLGKVDYRLRIYGEKVFSSDPRSLDWREIGSFTITHWRPCSG